MIGALKLIVMYYMKPDLLGRKDYAKKKNQILIELHIYHELGVWIFNKFSTELFSKPFTNFNKKNHHAFYKWFFLIKKLRNSTMDINGGLNWKSPELFFVLRNQIRIKIFSIVSIKSWYCESSRWWSSGKNLGSRGLLPLWPRVRALWLLIWWPLEVYMVVNFKARGINRGARKLARTLSLKKKKVGIVFERVIWGLLK